MAPVILVGELFPFANAKDAALMLANHFLSQGYNVSAFMEEGISELLGFHSTGEIFDINLAKDDVKIDFINHKIQEIETAENPDIIIIQVPGGMMQYNDIVTNNHGIYFYMMTQAIQMDYFVFCIPAERMYEEMIEKYNELLLARFGKQIDTICLSNLVLDGTSLLDRFEFDSLYLPQEKLDAHMKNNNFSLPVFNVLSTRGLYGVLPEGREIYKTSAIHPHCETEERFYEENKRA